MDKKPIRREQLWMVAVELRELARKRGVALTWENKFNVPGKYVLALELSTPKPELEAQEVA